MAAARKKRAPAKKSAKKRAAKPRAAKKRSTSARKSSAGRRASGGGTTKKRVLPNDKAWRELLETALEKRDQAPAK